MEQTTVNQRLNLIVDTFESGKKAAFARKVGMSPQGVQEILAGRKGDPSFKVLVKILETYPQVCMDWLVLGQEPMLRKETIAEKTYSGHIGRFPVKSASGNTEVAIIAGDRYNRLKWDYLRRNDTDIPNKEEEAAFALSNSPYAYDSLSLPASMLKPGLVRAFPMPGNGMEPSFGEGDLIIATQVQNIDWNVFPNESTKGDIINTFPMCVIEYWSEKERGIEFGRCCMDETRKALRCFEDRRVYYPRRIALDSIKGVWEFNYFISNRALNPALELVDKVSELEYKIDNIKKEAKLYVRLKHRIRELILEWGTSMQMLGQDFDDYKKDEDIRKYYLSEVGTINNDDEYTLKLLSIIQPLIIEFTSTLEMDFTNLKTPKIEPGMPPLLHGE